MNFSAISSASMVGRVLRSPLRLLPKETRMRVVQGPLRGHRWIAGAHTHGCWLGSYELEKQQTMAALVRPGSVVYDVGANAGFYALLASKLTGAAGHVVAFEPQPRNLRYLRAHLNLNRIQNVTVLDLAVSDAPGRAQFSEAGSATGSLDALGTLSVRTSSLDALVDAAVIPPPDLIKMDIEGGELRALKGASRILSTFKPTILLATHGRDIHRACIAQLEQAGYEIRAIDETPLDRADELLATSKAD